ncbi:4-hydroxy-tetrahydrodipicolinate synthase [Ferrovum sp. JA12]|uniref:4-hydroxy-tetrahydrodipicolinate synthase n=1 Tax=Ferrovum sp. JA12 TaxID=1356299 RepID=UPI000702C1F6|nr:4-hydroxy-tetrahydrodipicolinate synthase [Ferrovum sp. JA12]KRH78033.1 4-hydroxy-tetrahydrodipicolinate synthase [Ferrovum sp. JA12]
MLQGSLVAIVTPMKDDGELDFDALTSLIDWHIDAGTAGIVIVGTTGESPTVSVAEHKALIDITVKHVAGRVAVIAGTGANSTQEAIELTRFAQQVGADYSLSVVPYYNKPTQQGMYEHFKAIAEAVTIPIILYNVPGRTVADLANDTVVRLSAIKNIVGLKDATADLYRASDLFDRLPADFACYTGDDGSAAAFMLMGGHGVISVTANVAPQLMADLCRHALAGDVAATRRINNKLLGLHRDLFVEANPIPVKWALAEMGRMGQYIRLPLTPLSEAHHHLIRAALQRAEAI